MCPAEGCLMCPAEDCLICPAEGCLICPAEGSFALPSEIRCRRNRCYRDPGLDRECDFTEAVDLEVLWLGVSFAVG